MAKRILIRRDTTENWNTVNPILSNGELGIEFKSDGKRSMKLGTGGVAWNSLPYFIDNPAPLEELESHINNTSAHSATAVPAPSLIAMYNSEAGLKSDRVPVEENDVVRKIELDTASSNISGLTYDINTVETGLYSETQNRISGDTYLQSEIDTIEDDLETETNNRILSVSGLQSEIDTVETNLNNEITNRVTAISGVIYTASVDATTKANTAESNAKQYADDLSLATQVWLPSVETFDDLPTNPGNGTYLCRVTTGADYGVYQWIGAETTPSWTFFSDNSDFMNKIVNPTTDNIPIITSEGELVDGGESILGILNTVSGWVNTKENTISSGTTSQYYRGDKTWTTFPTIPAPANSGILTIQKNSTTIDTFSANADTNKTINIAITQDDVGLSNVDNTSDANKPISTAVSGALSNKEPNKYVAADESAAETYSTANPTIMVFYPEE
jgi:hypothetical protein